MIYFNHNNHFKNLYFSKNSFYDRSDKSQHAIMQLHTREIILINKHPKYLIWYLEISKVFADAICDVKSYAIKYSLDMAAYQHLKYKSKKISEAKLVIEEQLNFFINIENENHD